jgi:hypothetical protein
MASILYLYDLGVCIIQSSWFQHICFIEYNFDNLTFLTMVCHGVLTDIEPLLFIMLNAGASRDMKQQNSLGDNPDGDRPDDTVERLDSRW